MSTVEAQGWIARLPETVSDADRRHIGWWLVLVSLLLAVLVLVGGITRLTDSGLSIVEWKPVTGMLPPLSQDAWEGEFEKYKAIPEYELVNFDMTLEEFKSIFWWEWIHRFIARMLGFAFFIPFVVFLIKRKVPRELFPKLTLMFVLGGAQGALGWFMVMSGLSERVDVSQYRLTAHLGLAFFIYAFMLWVAFAQLLPKTQKPRPDLEVTIKVALGLVALVYIQVLLGGFVAGLHAGLVFNTWPLMNDAFIPPGYWNLSPWFLNFFENHGAVQFNHRMVAYALTIYAAVLFYQTRHIILSQHAAYGRLAILITVLIQVGLGIWTLLAVVPIWLGVLHQAGSLLVFTAALYFVQALRQDCRGVA